MGKTIGLRFKDKAEKAKDSGNKELEEALAKAKELGLEVPKGANLEVIKDLIDKAEKAKDSGNKAPK